MLHFMFEVIGIGTTIYWVSIAAAILVKRARIVYGNSSNTNDEDSITGINNWTSPTYKYNVEMAEEETEVKVKKKPKKKSKKTKVEVEKDGDKEESRS